MELGRIGVWTGALSSKEPADQGVFAEAAAEVDELGYGAIWIGGSPGLDRAAKVLADTKRIVVGTSILNIWQHTAADVAAGHAAITAEHPGRFVLGLGASHAPFVDGYRKPLSHMREYLDELDRAGQPQAERALAALGPKMLELSRDRAAGALPYLVTPEHTARAREILGAGPLLVPELKVVLEEDPATARAIAREHLAIYLKLPNYLNSLLSLGFTEEDFADGGSDRLVDETVAWGDEEVVASRLNWHFEEGADHVAIQVIGERLPLAQWRRLAPLVSSGQ